MTDFLKKTLKEIEARRRELEPLVDEYRRLEQDGKVKKKDKGWYPA